MILRRETALLLAVVLLGAATRLHGLDWGLPWALHIDERLFVVAKSIHLENALEQEGEVDPGITSYGILPLWLLVLARKLFLDAVAAAGPPTYGDHFAATVLLSRWISALWGIATIVLVYFWARRWSGTTGVAAAALVAGFPALVQTAHFGTVEAPLVALLVLGMLLIERFAERRTWGRAAGAGAVLGLAISVKTPGAVLLFPLIQAVAPEGWRRGLAKGVVAVGVAVALVVALNPAMLAPSDAGSRSGEHTTLAGNLRRAYSSDFHDWTLPYTNDVPVWTELTSVLPYAMGALPLAAALLGLALAFRRRDEKDLRLLLMLVPILLLVLPARVKTVRFLLPALPALAILAAEVVRRLGGSPKRGAVATAVLVTVALLQGAAFTAIYAAPDSRIEAARWLDRNVEEHEIVAVEDPPGYGPPIGSPVPAIERAPLRYEILWRGFYTIHERSDAAARRSHLDRVLRKADYLVLSEGHRAEFTAAPELRPVESAFYEDLDEGRLGYEKVAEFKSYPRLGPLELRDDRAEVLMRVFDHPRIEIWRKVEG